MCFLTILLLNWQCVSNCVQWNLRIKETSLNKRNLSIMNRIACPKTSLSYSANTFITSEERNLSIMNRITCPKTSLSYSANTFITSEERNLSIMNRITCPKTSLSYSANTFITSEERKPLYNEQNNLSQKLRYSEVPLYLVEKVANNSLTQVVRPLSYKKANIYVVRVCVIEKYG